MCTKITVLVLFCFFIPLKEVQTDEDIRKWETCSFIRGFANWLYHRAVIEEIPEDRIHFMEDGYDPEQYAVMLQMKREVYHDMYSLQKRVNAACVAKLQS